MSRHGRPGLYVGGALLLLVLLGAALVWRVEGVTLDRVMRPPPPANVAIVRLELGALPGLHVRPGTNVEIKCEADSLADSILFMCEARQKVREK